MEFDKAELSLYEAVEKMPPFSRKTLVLVSPPGLGKQQIIRRLVDSNTDMFGTTLPSKYFIIKHTHEAFSWIILRFLNIF